MGQRGVPSSRSGPAACVIDCEGRGRGVRFHNSETAEAVLEGFTIRNGERVNGGAILCRSASPTILNCVLANNQSREGGGLYSFGGNPTISNCVISENSSLRGAGLMFHGGSPTVTDCEITGNWLFGTAGGGGMNNANSDPTVTNCTFSENSGDFGAWPIRDRPFRAHARKAAQCRGVMQPFRRADHRLGRHAADIDAGAADHAVAD